MSRAGERRYSTSSKGIWGCIQDLHLPCSHRLVPSLSHWVTFVRWRFPVGVRGGQHWTGGIFHVPDLAVPSLPGKDT